MGSIKNQVIVCGFFSSVILEHKLTLKNNNILQYEDEQQLQKQLTPRSDEVSVNYLVY